MSNDYPEIKVGGFVIKSDERLAPDEFAFVPQDATILSFANLNVWGRHVTVDNGDGTYTHSIMPAQDMILGRNGNSFRQRPDGKFENY